MICVYPADCADFSMGGNGTCPAIGGVTETLNGEYGQNDCEHVFFLRICRILRTFAELN